MGILLGRCCSETFVLYMGNSDKHQRNNINANYLKQQQLKPTRKQ